MGTIEDVRTDAKDTVVPDMKAIKDRLSALEAKLEQQHTEKMTALGGIIDYNSILQRLAALEARLQR